MKAGSNDNVEPPDAARVAARALVLAAVTFRGFIEGNDDNEGGQDKCYQVLQWLLKLELDREAEAAENLLTVTPFGQLDEQQMIDATWRKEGMVVLAWALGVAELPRYDVECEHFPTARALGFLRERRDIVLARPSLRLRAEIQEKANTYLTLHWRMRQHLIAVDRGDVGPVDFAGYVSWAKWGPLTLAGLDLIDGDLSVGGERIDRASQDACELTGSIARERHKALNWLLGYAHNYSRVATHT